MTEKNDLNPLVEMDQISEGECTPIEDKTTQPEVNLTFTESRKIIMAGLIIVGLFFGFGGAWVTFAEINGAVIANGEVRVDTERKTVQHLEGGIVREILVRNGDKVKQGQPLILLDGARVIAAVDQTQLQLTALEIKQSRLIAEQELGAQVNWPANDGQVPQAKFSELLAAEKKVFYSGRQSLENQIALINKQIDQLREQIQSIADRLVAEGQVSEALQEELDTKMVLYESQYIEKTQILGLQRALAEKRATQAQLRGSQAEMYEREAEFDLRIDMLKNDVRQKAVTSLSEVQQAVSDTQQRLLPLQDARQRLVVSAPVSGEVVALNVHSRDGVVSPGQPLLDIVPEDSPLIIENHIKVSDINHVFLGQEADVQLLAFSTRTKPKVKGKVVYISADRIMQQTPYGEQPTYVVHVQLNKQELIDNDLYLTAGMPASVFIKTDPRTVLDYALEPLKENFDRALREN